MNGKQSGQPLSNLGSKGIRLLLVLVFVFVGMGGSLVVEPRPAYACSCAFADTTTYAVHADTIFSGTVVDRREIPPALNGSRSSADPVYYMFEVDKAWKGEAYETTTLSTEISSSSCGADFKMGERYLVFARQGEAMLKTGLCSGNEVYASGIEPAAVQELGEPVELRSGASLASPEGDWGGGFSSLHIVWWIAGAAALLLAIIIIVRKNRGSRQGKS